MKISGKTFDLKFGYSCNNHCTHCVIEEQKNRLLEHGKSINESYLDLLKIMETSTFKEADKVILTGGEITIRRDMMRIIKHILKKYPKKIINLQTNGRLLGKFIEELYELTDKVGYTIAMHDIDEAIHNKIVDNQNDRGDENPYQETLNSIYKIKEVYGGFDKVGQGTRIEVVLSRDNMNTLAKSIQGFIDLGITNIGVSYPHLDGFYIEQGEASTKKIGFSYKEILPQIPEIIKIAENNPKISLMFEEFPPCIWRNENGKLVKRPKNIDNLTEKNTVANNVKFVGSDESLNNFKDIWSRMHKHTRECYECEMRKQDICLGIWEESKKMWGNQGLKAITKEEMEVLK